MAGIADQPLQSITRTRDDLDDPSTVTQTATGIVSGMGKGLVGVVTKPIGGAAELVSQAGMGLLHGTGLASFPEQRHKPMDEDIGVFPNGWVKYSQ